MAKQDAAAKADAAEQVDTAATYEVLVGMNWPSANGEMRAEPGDVVPDPKSGLAPLPQTSIPWLLADGHIRKVGA